MFTYDTKSCVYRVQYVMFVYEWSFHAIFSNCLKLFSSLGVKLLSVSVWVFCLPQKHVMRFRQAIRKRSCKIQEHLSRLRFQISICHDLRRRLKSQFCENVRYDLRRALKSWRWSTPYAEIVRGKSKKILIRRQDSNFEKRCVQSWPFKYAIWVRRA
jgi:hypothetical protein